MPAEPTSRSATKIEPWVSWSVLTDGPLKGLGLAREAGLVLAWDEAERLYLIDSAGGFRSVATAPGRVAAAAVSDDGSRVAVLGEGARLWLLDGDLGMVADRPAPPDPLALAIDPHGRYLVVSGRTGANHVFNRHGRPAGKFESFQPLAHLAFVAARPLLIASAAHGLLAQFDLGPGGSGRLEVDLAWQDRQVSNVGRLTTTGDGSMILASCFTHGVQRYDAHGENATWSGFMGRAQADDGGPAYGYIKQTLSAPMHGMMAALVGKAIGRLGRGRGCEAAGAYLLAGQTHGLHHQPRARPGRTRLVETSAGRGWRRSRPS